MTRIIDFLLSFTAIIFLIPLLIPIIVVLSTTGEGYVFYRQKRVGYKGQIFGLLKFVTMLKDSPKLGSGDITVKNDPRILPFGSFLRISKINELPQLVNIIKGDMSIVGPRPLTETNFNYYSKAGRKVISTVRPGLTGVGSIVFRDESKFLENRQDPIEFYRTKIAPNKEALEMWYLKHNSILLYFKIIVLTVVIVLFPRSKLPDLWLGGKPELIDDLRKVDSEDSN